MADPTLRKMSLKVEVDAWSWGSSSKVSNTFDITPLAISWQWQKSIKTPAGGCTITCLPQLGNDSLIELINPMDVVRISEFGTVKFVGYIRRISFSGTIDPSGGKPQRVVVLSIASMGAILQESNLGSNLFLMKKSLNFVNKAADLSVTIADLCKQENRTIGDIVQAIISTWLDFIDGVSGSTAYSNWFNSLIDYQKGLTNTKVPGYAREFMAFHGTEETLSLWDVLTKFAETPFYELWFDSGPRKVMMETKESDFSDSDSKTYLMCRRTPYNGSVSFVDGSTQDLFDSLKPVKVPLNLLRKYDLNKSMEEVYTFYISRPAIWNMQDRLLVATGEARLDEAKMGKYLYRPLTVQQFYERIGDAQKNAGLVPNNLTDLQDSLSAGALTLKNWYQYNDIMLSGAILMMVPTNPENDVRIGDRIELEGLQGAFYVESVSHSWKYGDPLTASLNVTRGIDGQSEISLANKIFKTMKQGQI
jgi:hypothetical protein